MIKGNGIWYQVTDQDGNVVYGTLAEQPYTSKEDLFTNLLDKKVLRNGYYIESVPIEQEQGIRGAVILAFISFFLHCCFPENSPGKLTAPWSCCRWLLRR